MPATSPRDRGLSGGTPRPPELAQRAPATGAQAPGRPELDVVILAGGRAERLGGVDKPGLVVGSATMAAAVTRAAVAAGARQVILVGPARDELAGDGGELRGGLTVVREEPPGAGPVPALRAGLARVAAPWLALLAADLPFLRAEHVRELLAAAARPESESAGAVLADDEGRPQWLAGCWPAARLRAALAGYPGSSLRGVLGPLRPRLLRLAAPAGGPPPWLDCDTPAELAAARAWGQDAPLGRTPGRESRPQAGGSAPPAAGAARLLDAASRPPAAGAARPDTDPPTARRARS